MCDIGGAAIVLGFRGLGNGIPTLLVYGRCSLKCDFTHLLSYPVF
jgi:hypothetical protein